MDIQTTTFSSENIEALQSSLTAMRVRYDAAEDAAFLLSKMNASDHATYKDFLNVWRVLTVRLQSEHIYVMMLL